GGNHIEKLSYISKFTHDKFTTAVESEFIATVKSNINLFELENIYNTDESGFNLKLYSNRTLITQGVKTKKGKDIRILTKSILYKSEYIEKRPPQFKTLVDFCFNGKNIQKIYSWCKKYFCMQHFFEEYYKCEHLINQLYHVINQRFTSSCKIYNKYIHYF
ncbi:hypothetical protein ALC53_04867, partial [Atta colombica]